MIRKVLFPLIVFCLLVSSIQADVNGDTLRVEDKKVLKVWGTHYERGYATGWLMGNEIMEIAVDYVIESVFFNSAALYYSTRAFFDCNYSVEVKYENEAQGIIDGMYDSGVELYIQILDKDIDITDLFMANSIVDLSVLSRFDIPPGFFGCSSMSSWGESTWNDPELNGQLVITRNMDWFVHPVLLDNHLLVVQIPAEADEVPWISFTFPGMLGALSAINANNLATFMNVGNINNYNDTSDLHPIFFSIRNGIESSDYNEDGFNSIEDIVSAIEDQLHLSGSIVHAAQNDLGMVIETNNISGTLTRTVEDNTVISGDNLVATNHFRMLYQPVYCYRYENFADSLSANSQVDIDRSWDVTTGAGGVWNNLHTIQFVPVLDVAKWSAATSGNPAYTLEPTIFVLDELFEPETGNSGNDIIMSGTSLNVYPNPFYASATGEERSMSITIDFYLDKDGLIDLSIYNLRGQKIDTVIEGVLETGKHFHCWSGTDRKGRTLESGIYLVKLSSGKKITTKKLMLLK